MPTDQLAAVAALITRVLGDKALGSCLYGSVVGGGLKPASDVDVLVVTRERLDAAERQALVRGLMPISGSRVGARPLEVTVVVQAEVRPWRYPPVGDFLYGEWRRDDFEAGRLPVPEPMPNLAVEITQALAADRPLTGPSPRELLDPVPPADLVRGGLDGLPALLDDLPDDARNVLLTLARVWSTVATGEIRSKDAAADWALERLPPGHHPALARARDLYLTSGYADEVWDDEVRAGVPDCATALLARIEAAASPLPQP